MRTKLFSPLFVAVGVALASCGGGSSGAPSTEDFCAELQQLETMPETDDLTAGLEAFAGLVDKAPNDEVREALVTLSGLLESLGEFDENDPNAFAAVFGLFFNPEVIKAGEVLETFGVEECGLEPSEDTGGLTDGWTDATEDTDFSGNDMGQSIMDTVSAGDLSDAMNRHLEMAGSGYFVSGSSLSSAGDHTLVEVTLGGEGDLDALEACLAADSWLRSSSDDDKIALRITLEATSEIVAGYELGGSCSES